MTTIDPRALEAAARAMHSDGWTCDTHEPGPWGECQSCTGNLTASLGIAITAYLAVTQPVVETVEELEDLDYGSVVELRDGTIRLRADWGSGWASVAAGDDYPDDADLPARVIWRPHESA